MSVDHPDELLQAMELTECIWRRYSSHEQTLKTCSYNNIICLVGVYIQFNGERLSNNSVVLITDIGESNASVLCVTNKTDCCRYDDGGAVGEWYFPDRTNVDIEGNGGSFYRNRDQRVVRLHRRHNAMMPTGPFCCEVPDANNMNQRLCIIVSVAETTTSEGTCVS